MGRVGGHEDVKTYPPGSWDRIYKDKTSEKKHYKDFTHLRATDVTVVSGGCETSDEGKFLELLQGYAKKSITTNYIVTSESVTQAMVDEAQQVLDNIARRVKGGDINELNRQLLLLFGVIPRRMSDVHDFLFQALRTQDDLDAAAQILANEQDVLDTMGGQVIATAATANKPKSQTQSRSLADIMGVEIVSATPAEIKLIKDMMDGNGHKLERAFKINHKKTEDAIRKFLPHLHADKRELFWHGSRNENWFNILQTGLLIRPTGVAIQGNMFDSEGGIYFADTYRKSENYTSLNGSYWAKGHSNTAYLSLFEVLVGRQKDVYHADSSLSYSRISREGYDSVFAHGGADLRFNEYIVYTISQTTVKFVIEISA